VDGRLRGACRREKACQGEMSLQRSLPWRALSPAIKAEEASCQQRSLGEFMDQLVVGTEPDETRKENFAPRSQGAQVKISPQPCFVHVSR